MSWNPQPAFGGALWNGNQTVATTRQLISTTGGIISTINNLPGPSTTNISTAFITVSTFSTLFTNFLLAGSVNMIHLSTVNLSTGSFQAGTGGIVNANMTTANITTANITTLNVPSINTGDGTFSNLTVNNSATFNNNITNFTYKTLSNVQNINSGTGALTGCNLNLTATNALNGTANLVQMEANRATDVTGNSELTLLARRGNRGKIMLDARPGEAGIQGEIEIKATGGSPPLGAPTLGGRITLNATNPFPLTSVSPSYVIQTADSILAYAGAITPVSGNYGYNYQQGLNGVNIVAGTGATIPNVIGTVYLYGTNVAGTGNSGGVRITNGLSVDVIYPYPTGFISPPYDLILKGNSAGNKVSLSNVRNIQSDGGDLTGFYTAFSSNIDSQICRTSNFTASNTGFISSLTANEINIALPVSFNTLNVLSTATINKLILPNTPTFSIEQNFFSTSGGGFNTISSATNNILSTSISLTTASLPEINLINNQVFNNANISYWASTIVVAQTTDLPILSNTLAGISPNTGRLVYRNNSGVPLVIYAPYNGGTTGIVIPQNSNWGFTYNGSYWDINQNPTDVGGTYGTSFSMYQNYNTTTFKSPDIISLDAPVVNITGTLGNTNITTANITTATINQINASNITLANTPSYSIEQSFISTTGSFFNTISNATNYILSTSISLTAATQAQNPIVPNLNIGNSNVDYWASTIQVATDTGAAPSIINSLTPLTGGLTGQITYSNASLTKTIVISRFGGTQPPLTNIPPGSNYQFTYDGTDWLLNTTPSNTSGTSGTSFSLFQTYNNTTLKTPDILTLDAPVVNITGLVNGINIGTATIQEATANQIFTSNITMSNTPTFGLQQSFFSTTTQPFNSISSIQNLILSTSMGFTSATQEQQPFIPAYFISANNYNNWNNVIYVKNTVVDPTTSFQEFNVPMTGVPTGSIVQYINNSSQNIQIINFVGGGDFTVFPGSNFRYTWNGSIWTENRSPGTLTTTYGTSFAISQNYFNTTLKSPDTITIDSANLNITGLTTINRLNLTRLNLSTITTSNLTAANATITNLNTVTENTRTMTYSTITGAPTQGTTGITQNVNYTAIGRTINLASNLQYSVFPYISSLTTQTLFNNTINYNTYPGGFFQLMPSGSVGGQVLNANGTMTSPNPLTGISWYSSIMGVYGAAGGSSNYYVITAPPASQKGEFILYGNRPGYGQYQLNVNGVGVQIAISSNDYHRWTNSNGTSWSSNLNSVAYPTINTTDTASLIMKPGGLLNINAQYVGFANDLRVVSYTERITTSVQNAGVYGKAQVDNIQVQFQGKKFSSSDYNCTISFNQWGATQVNLATNEAAVNVYPDAQGNWLYQVRMTTATIPAFGVDAYWQPQILLTPRVFATGTNTTATFSDPEIWAPLEIPGQHVSSITASTMTMIATENLIFGAGVGVPTVLGNQGITLNANSNIGIVANNDIQINASNNMYLTATSSILMSNVGGTAGFGFDSNAVFAGFGSNVVLHSYLNTYINADSNLYLNGSNSINIESLSTIYLQSYNSYTTASNVYDLHNTVYSNISASNQTYQTPDFIVSTCKNSYYIQNIRQPFIQYGDITGSSNTGSDLVVLPVPYASISSYKAFATMEDSEPAEMSCVRNSESTFTIYWQQAASGTHTIAWNTMGNVEGCGGAEPPPPPPAEDPAYDLINNIYGNTMYAEWTPGGSPDYYTVYVLQSADNIDYPVYTSADAYSPAADFFSLPENYWYKFYVSSHYGGTRVDSSNSSEQYVYAM